MNIVQQFVHQQFDQLSVDQNGVGRGSIRFTASLAGIDQSTLGKALKAVEVSEVSKLAQFLMGQGVKGEVLSNLSSTGVPDTVIVLICDYYAFEAGRFCTEQARAVIRALANIELRQLIHKACNYSTKIKSDNVGTKSLDEIDRALSMPERHLRIFGELNPIVEQAYKDLVGNVVLGHQAQLTGTKEDWMGIVNFAEVELNYSVPMKGEHCRTSLGKWITFFYPHLAERKDRRLCNETQQRIWVYPIHLPDVRKQLEEAVTAFFNHKAPGTHLKLSGAYKQSA